MQSSGADSPTFFSRASLPSLHMTTTHPPDIGVSHDSLESPLVIQDLVRLHLQLQSRIAAVRNASENDLSFQAVEEQNSQIKTLFTELEAKLEVRLDLLKPFPINLRVFFKKITTR